MTRPTLKVSDYRKAQATIARLEWGMIALLVTIFLVSAVLVHDKRILQEENIRLRSQLRLSTYK